MTVLEEIVLPKTYREIRERPGYFLGLGDITLDLIDRRTGAIVRTIPLPVAATHQLVLAPATEASSATSFISAVDQAPGSSVRYLLLQVGEATGTVHIVPNISAWGIQLDPTGQYLMYSASSRWEGELTRLRNGGDISAGVRTSFDPHMAALQLRPGTGSIAGQIKIPAIDVDGVIAMLMSSDPGALGRVPFSDFSTDEHFRNTYRYLINNGTRRGLSLHPSEPVVAMYCTVPAVKVLEPSQIRFFERQSGQLITGRCEVDGKTFSQIRKITFSPDGTRLLVMARNAEGRESLQSFAFEKGAAVASAPATRPVANVSKPPPMYPPPTTRAVYAEGAVASGELESLVALPASTPARSPKQLAAMVDTSASVGSYSIVKTGFFVGSKGFILTTTEALTPPEVKTRGAVLGVAVRYSVPGVNGKPHEVRAAATIVRADHEKGLMLIKIDMKDKPFPVAHLAQGDGGAVGESVVVFGYRAEAAMYTGTISAKDRIANGAPAMQLAIATPAS